ncbi:MAG TPA: MBL fold metallo-hydrolase, partial [Limnochordia bacterium]|nr:MBL fold metallo-hydrolase [Limnochordia bacterium]
MRPRACTDSQRAFSIVCPVGPLASARATLSATVAVLLLAIMCILGGRSAAAATSEPLTFPTERGPLVVTTLGHASLMFKWNGEVIYVDPVSAQADFNLLPDADQIWITHDHGDHLDPKAIAQIRTGATQIVADTHSAAKLGAGVIALHNGEQTTIGGVTIQAVPAYNLVRGPSAAQKYHRKGWYNGYIADFGGFR